MFEDFINALQNFRQNKTRTFLSLLGVIIGVASVILITTLGQSATENVKKIFWVFRFGYNKSFFRFYES